MAQLGNFNPDAVPDDERDFPIVPDGNYHAHVIESDLIATKRGDGQILKLTWEILEGPCARRKLWENLNIANPNAQAQDISQRALKNICTAVGHVGVLNDSEALHFKPARIRVGHRDAQGEFKAQNVIKGYEPLGGANRPASAPTNAAYTPTPQQQVAQAASAGGKSRPWG